MTPQEKHQQMVKMRPYLMALTNETLPKLANRLYRAKTFPYFLISPEIELKGMGKWRIIYEAESKSSIRKGVACIRCYQTFHVSRSKDPLNIGTGIYLFNDDNYGGVSFNEYPPHYFNRLRKRFIEPKGIVQPNFHELVHRMLLLHHHSMDMVVRGYTFRRGDDGLYSMETDTSVAKKDGYDNFITYHKEGVSLGVCQGGKNYINFTTFVPNSMLREGQKEMQQKQMRDMLAHQYQQQLNPFATFEHREWIPKGKDI